MWLGALMTKCHLEVAEGNCAIDQQMLLEGRIIQIVRCANIDSSTMYAQSSPMITEAASHSLEFAVISQQQTSWHIQAAKLKSVVMNRTVQRILSSVNSSDGAQDSRDFNNQLS